MEPDKRVLLLHTGGTLGMQGSPLEPATYETVLDSAIPEISRIARVKAQFVCNLDSSDVGPEQWVDLARHIEAAHDEVDGVVIVHGTDTMAYTAAALAFTLRGLDKPIILTGAQRPLLDVRTDARRNLQDAFELAIMDIPEVGICFDGLLFRGSRAFKRDAFTYHAFDSPGVPPLARLGVDIQVGSHVRRPSEPFSCDPRFDPDVMVVYASPGLRSEMLLPLLDTGHLKGIVLAAFGMGTVPVNGRSLVPFIQRAVDEGIEVLVVTQHGGLTRLGAYRNGEALRDAGAISGGRMLIEAAVPKLMHALAAFPDPEARRAWLQRDVAGEVR